MWAQLAIVLLSTISLSQGFYCGNHNYAQGYCLCADGSWCPPQLYPTVCCDNTTMPTWFSGQWILIDTTDSTNTVDTTKPITISTMNISIPWNPPVLQSLPTISWKESEIYIDSSNPLNAIAMGSRLSDGNLLQFRLELSVDPNPPTNITFSYAWSGLRIPNYKGIITLAPYPNAQPKARDFLSINS